MSTITVTFRRTWRPADYESQTVEFTVTDEVNFAQSSPKIEEALTTLYRRLNVIGDQMMGEALARPRPQAFPGPHLPRG